MPDKKNKESDVHEKPVDQLTYEEAFRELEEIVSSLESEEHSLDNALLLFERGQMLAKHSGSLLDQAELRVQQVSGEETVPFEVGE